MNQSHISFILKGNLEPWKEQIISFFGSGTSYPAGTVFSHTAVISPEVFYLLSGIVKVYTTNLDGTEAILGYHQKGTIFALDSFRGTDPCVVTTEAVDECQVIRIPSGRFHDFVIRNPELAYQLLLFEQDVIRLMCWAAEQQNGTTVAFRLASFFLVYMDSDYYAETDSVRLSQEDLAKAIGASRIQTARVEERMQKKGILRILRGRVIITSRHALEQIAQNPRFLLS
ncbi:MAG: Crp/Fnr family transcriptional regulator [Bulleidia sp.]